MERIDWCLKQKSGIKKVEESTNLAREYIDSAEESLRVLSSIKGTESNMWLATTKYYAEYFAFYAFLMRVGVKSEIHDCTIELARLLEKNGFLGSGTAGMLERDKEIRIDNQYYLRNKQVDIDMESLRSFVLGMKGRIDSLSKEDIERIRKLVWP